MAKQLIVSVMEDIVGEYILNISKENLKIAALKGKVKLENVQLDGDLIGSHVLGAVGLSGFGVLSCWAKSVKIIVPLKNLERQPTRFEIHGVHLLCVPLLPSTAHKRYGAGTAIDPRCSLRTRAKRSALARFERNFFHGRIPGEGPPTRRMRTAMKHAEREMRKSQTRWRSKRAKDDDLDDDVDDDLSDFESSLFGDSTTDEKKSNVPESMVLQKNWKVKLREKVLRNIEVSINEMHVRCEVSKGGLDFCHPGRGRKLTTKAQEIGKNNGELPAEQRAFSFGMTLDTFVVRTAQEGQGFNRSESSFDDSSVESSSKNVSVSDSLPSSTSSEVKYKVAEINNLSIYWDDEPPLLLSECPILSSSDRNLSATRLQRRIAAAMDAMVHQQHPGEAIKQSLWFSDTSSPARKASMRQDQHLPHSYCCKSFSSQLNVRLGDRNQPGPMTLLAEFRPMRMEMYLRPHQFVQYNKLRSAMLSQQRFDTMLHQRPTADPLSNPKLWWKYVIACVTTRPTSRPWEDVVKISRCRKRYIELVRKKLHRSAEGNGFHGGLKDDESIELLAMEDLLPIEALLSFHLIACRSVYEMRREAGKSFFEVAENEEVEVTKPQSRPRLKNPFRRSKKSSQTSEPDVQQILNGEGGGLSKSFGGSGISKESVYQEIVSRMGKKQWYNTFLLDDAQISVTLIQNDQPILRFELRASGEVRTFGPSRQDFMFDVIQFEIIDPLNRLEHFTPHRISDRGKILMFEDIHRQNCDFEKSAGGSNVTVEPAMVPPPRGIVCRLTAAKDPISLKLGISAHPATLVWSKPCLDAVSEFFSNPTTELHTEVTQQLRNVATPLARRALLALLSPGALILSMNIAAPKVWVPVSGETSDGAVFLDAGKFIMSITKLESKIAAVADTVWNLAARDIQLMFIRQFRHGHHNFDLKGEGTSRREAISVVQPLQLHVEAVLAERELELPLWNPAFSQLSLHPDNGPWRKLEVTVSPICLNLVDAEILARAIGKWYANGLVRVKTRSSTRVNDNERIKTSRTKWDEPRTTDASQLLKSARFMSGVGIVSIHVERLELALEGHSKQAMNVPDDRSINTLTSDMDVSDPKKRTYFVQLLGINFARLSQHGVSKSKWLVADVDIFRIKDDISVHASEQQVYETQELEHCILIRSDKDVSAKSPHYVGKVASCYNTPKRMANESVAIGRLHVSPPVDTADSLDWSPSSKMSVGEDSTDFLSVSLLHDQTQHLDEVEIDMESIILRVTPTTMKDCAKGFRKIFELMQLVTREMERKIHEEGRRARLERNDSGGSPRDSDSPRHASAAGSEVDQKAMSDSSILFKVTFNEITLLVGRPLSLSNTSLVARGNTSRSNAVIQVSANALVMFQSVENIDGSGCKTVHASIDNLCATANTEFTRILPTELPPMAGPTAAEFRIVYGTENLGSVMSQDIALDCEALKASLTPNDLFIIKSVVDRILQRLHRYGFQPNKSEKLHSLTDNKKPQQVLKSLIRYQKKGTGIATGIRIEVQRLSFVLLEAYRSKQGTRPLFDLSCDDLKGHFKGCMTAISGECSASFSLNHFNVELNEWESVLEPVHVELSVGQMPDELVMEIASSETVQTNVTSVMLKDYLKTDLSILRSYSAERRKFPWNEVSVDSSTLSTIGLRRATEAQAVYLRNQSGLDLLISQSHNDQTTAAIDSILSDFIEVQAGTEVPLDFLFSAVGTLGNGRPRLKLQLAPSSVALVGNREPLSDLPSSSQAKPSVTLHRLHPLYTPIWENSGESVLAHLSGRFSPETVVSEHSMQPDISYYNAEPVVEWCMQNQRLRASITDCYSLSKGRDLLSSHIWSPGDERYSEQDQLLHSDPLLSGLSESADESDDESQPRKPKTTTTRPSQRSNWVKPYLKGDPPEWTDMTCILRMTRERVMLPDNNWVWLNDWTVDVSGSYGESTDCDGWEYAADFETFDRERRFYKRGDAYRRRRWTRTRMVRPPSISDPLRPLFLVWETACDNRDNFIITVRSHLTIHNHTGIDLELFLSSPSWEEASIGVWTSGESLPVPVKYAAASYLRLGVPRGGETSKLHKKKPIAMSRRIMIVPSGHTSSSYVRTVINVNPSDGQEILMGQDTDRKLHFLIHITSKKGVVDLWLHPVVIVMNLLPCELECEFGESDAGSPKTSTVQKEHITVPIGGEGRGIALNPGKKPHIRMRLPGYNFSAWQRIINRRASSATWQPSAESEAEWQDEVNEVEYQTVVFFGQVGGDPLNILMGVEQGHCPIIRIWAQFWIVNKTGFPCRFAESLDYLGTTADVETSRRSHTSNDELKAVTNPGHQWSIGQEGLTLYFSKKRLLHLRIEHESRVSSWVTPPIDVSNVIPKTAFSVDESSGKRFELAVTVSYSPINSRTKLITLYPRYQIINMMQNNDLIVAQDGSLVRATCIKPLSSVPFHWERKSLPPKVRLGHALGNSDDDILWSNGCIQLDKIGITSMRFPLESADGNQPLVVQAEVRLASKEQSSAVVVVIWSTNEKLTPLYLLRNSTSRTILCRQPLYDDVGDHEGHGSIWADCAGSPRSSSETRESGFECGTDLGPILKSFLGLDTTEEFVWVLRRGETAFFGFDDPEKVHIIEWTCVLNNTTQFDKRKKNAFAEVDAMGSFSVLPLSDGSEVRCHISAEHSTKVIEFIDQSKQHRRNLSRDAMSRMRSGGRHYEEMLGSVALSPSAHYDTAEEEDVAFSLRISLPAISFSIIENGSSERYGREILLAQLDKLSFEFSQTIEGYHEMELRLMSLQVDNHVQKSIHPILIFCPKLDESEPLVHMSAVRRLQPRSSSLAFRYVAIRILDIEIFLDRQTAENIALFIQPLGEAEEENYHDPREWIDDITAKMSRVSRKEINLSSLDVDSIISTADSRRIYIEQLHLHPLRISLTFTQEWMEWRPGAEGILFFQFIRGMASIASAPLKFTSFMVGHVFEAPESLLRIIVIHYTSQLTKQIFGILGSLAILEAPADFISNIGTGVRDFFYEPINGLVHGPAQFVEGLEAGTQSLARGVFVGVVRGAANVTDVVNSNLAGLTADDNFIDERKAHQRMLTDAMSRGEGSRSFSDSLYLAGGSIARSVRSGAVGIWEQPAHYASKHGPVGFVKGVGKALVGALVKPVVGVGDAAVLVMNHVSDATSDKVVLPKIPKRLRRALPRATKEKPYCVRLIPYDDRAAKAQKIVTGGESLDDVYIGHVAIPSHLVIASDRSLWAIDNRTQDQWRVSWEEISHFGMLENDKMSITVFGQTGLRSYVFEVEDSALFAVFNKLLEMQANKMGNATSDVMLQAGWSREMRYAFGSCNNIRKRLNISIKDEIDVVEQCFGRVKKLISSAPGFFKILDEEAWNLINSWGQVFSGLSSRRCIAASIINGTGYDIQIKSTKLVEGGSPCYSIPTIDFDSEQGVLKPGGAIIFFGWGVVPNLLQAGNVFMSIETNAFVADLSVHKGRDTYAEATPGYHVGFLEKSYDESGWWAKYWLLVKRAYR